MRSLLLASIVATGLLGLSSLAAAECTTRVVYERSWTSRGTIEVTWEDGQRELCTRSFDESFGAGLHFCGSGWTGGGQGAHMGFFKLSWYSSILKLWKIDYNAGRRVCRVLR